MPILNMIYWASWSWPTPSWYTITWSTTVGSFTPWSFSDLQGFFISTDGLNAYATFWNSWSGRMAQYGLSTAWNISTASQTRYISVSKPNGFCFSNDGAYLFLSTESGNKITRYTLGTPRDISTATLDTGQSLSIPSNFALNVSLSEDGRYIRFGNWSMVYQYELTTPYDLTSATNQKSISATDWNCVQVKNDGKYLYSSGSDGAGTVKQKELATAYDITSTATVIGSYSLTIGEWRCLFVSNDCKYWAIWNTSSGITQYEAQPIS